MAGTNKDKTEDGQPSVNVDAFTTLTACCDLDLGPPKSNQVVSRGCWLVLS